MPTLDEIYAKLKAARASKTIALKPSPMLRGQIKAPDGSMQPFRLRYYQVQGIYHMLWMDRMVLGDACGIGKTIEALSTLCYLWDGKAPSLRAIVVAPKSALRQWDGELDRFATGVRTFVVRGKFEERKAIYKEWASSPTGVGKGNVLIINYAILVRDWDAEGFQPLLPNGHPDPKKPVTPGVLDAATQDAANRGGLVTYFDECFDYHTPIQLAGGGKELIGRIATKRLPVEVLSWNWESQQVESKRVVNWYRNPLRRGRREAMLKVQSRLSGVVNVTKSHYFYRTDGSKIRAGDLSVGDSIATLVTNAPSLIQEQIVLGGLLGDASVSHPTRDLWDICFSQSTKQEDYLRFKCRILAPLGVSEVSFYQTELQSGTQQMCRFRVNGNAFLTSHLRANQFIRDFGKAITPDFLDRLGPLALAVWYGDDGSLSEYVRRDGSVSRRIVLNTQGFKRAEVELLAGYLRWKWGVVARVRKVTNKKRQSSYHTLYLNNQAANRFLTLLPGALPGVEYKFPGMTPVDFSPDSTTLRQTIVRDEITSIEPWMPAEKPRLQNHYVYDLEVEDNHNYFANGVLVSNCTAFKNPSTKTWQTCRFLSDRSARCYGLTATLLKNNLLEGFAIYNVIRPGVFTTKTKFMNDFCVTQLQPIPGGRKVLVPVGYKNLDGFRQRIDPFFLGRAKHEVSDELPKLITKVVSFEMNTAEEAKYREALEGILELGDGETKEYQESIAFTSLIYCQQIVDSLHLLKFEEGHEIDVGTFGDENIVKVKDRGSKEQALADLLTEELDEEKVIVYTRFEKLVGRLQAILKAEGIKSVRITGKEKADQRREAQERFQDHKSDVKVVIVTDAAKEAINLQAASAEVFYDSPWSWGDYVQLLGRPIRIGSIHDTVVAYHLVAERPWSKCADRRTIDHAVLSLLDEKKHLVDKVLGESTVGALDFGGGTGSATRDLLRLMKERIKNAP
jgi:superfamily II DNA or RNA helicase